MEVEAKQDHTSPDQSVLLNVVQQLTCGSKLQNWRAELPPQLCRAYMFISLRVVWKKSASPEQQFFHVQRRVATHFAQLYKLVGHELYSLTLTLLWCVQVQLLGTDTGDMKCWASLQLVLNAILLYQGLKSDLTDSAFIWSIQFSIISYRIQLCCLQCLFLACHMSAVQDESSHTNIQLQILVVVRALSVISSVILCVSLRSALSSKSWRLRCSPSGRPRETDDQRERERWWRTIRRPQVHNTAWVHRNTASCLKYTASVHRNTVSVPSLMKLNCLSAAANQKAGKGGRKSVFDKELTNTSSKALKHYRAGWDTCLYVCSPVCLFTYL